MLGKKSNYEPELQHPLRSYYVLSQSFSPIERKFCSAISLVLLFSGLSIYCSYQYGLLNQFGEKNLKGSYLEEIVLETSEH